MSPIGLEVLMYTCASFFAGVGGIDKGFENAGLFKTVYANEFDTYPIKTYENNFPLKVDCRDIRIFRNSRFSNYACRFSLSGFFSCRL